MSLIDHIRAKARSSLKRIALPEGDEPRTVEAAEIIRREGLAEPILLTPERMREKSAEYAAALHEIRKSKGLTEEGAVGGKVKFTAGPNEKRTGAFFMRVRMAE